MSTARDLLDQAQAEAWALARGITLGRHTTQARESWKELRALAPEWPRLAAASGAARRAAQGLRPSAPATTWTLQLLDQIAHEQGRVLFPAGPHCTGPSSTETQTRMARMSQLLHATAELLASARQRGDFTTPHQDEADEISDRIARAAAAAATVTQIHLERVTKVGTGGAREHFAELAQSVSRHHTRRDAQGVGGLDLIAVAAPEEASLEGAMNRWETAAHLALEQPVLDPGAVRHIAVDAWAVNTARSAVLRHPDVLGPSAAQNSMAHRSSVNAQNGWAALVEAWPDHIGGAGRGDVTRQLRQASADLRAHLTPLLNRSHPDPAAQLPALTRALKPLDRIAQEYGTAVSTAVDGETFLAPARRLTRHALSADPRLALEAQRGRWVRLPKVEPAGQELVRAARSAARLALQAAEQIGMRSTSLPQAPEPARTRTGPAVGPSTGLER